MLVQLEVCAANGQQGRISRIDTMTIRTTKSTVTFRSPFRVKGMSEQQPAGTYEIETDEEAIEGNDRTVYRRVATLLILKDSGHIRTITIDPASLQVALATDQPIPLID